MNAEALLQHFERNTDTPDAIGRLRRFVLDLAVRGKLVSQDSKEEPAAGLLARISVEKARLLATGEVRTPKTLPRIADVPFEIPQSWRWTQIAEIGLLSPRNAAADDLPASFVPMTLITAEYGAAHGNEVRPWGEIKNGYTHFANGDVGLAKITPCFENGKSTVFRSLSSGIGSGTTELHVVRPLFVTAEYVALFLKCPHFIEAGIPKMTGTAGQKRVPTEYFAYSAFPLPPLAEQDRIVAKVNELMALCDQLEAARAKREAARDRLAAATLARLNVPDPVTFADDARFALDVLPALTARPDQVKQLRQTILSLAMRGRLMPQDAKDEPASSLMIRISKELNAFRKSHRLNFSGTEPVLAEDSPFTLPDGWLLVRLADLFRVITDGDHQPPPRANEGVAFLTIGNVTTGRLNFSGCRLVTREYFDSLASYRTPRCGDILYTVVGATFGRPALVETEREFCVQRHIAILKPASDMDVRFLLRMLSSPLVYDQAVRSTTGTAQPTIALGPLRNFLVPVPPVGEQMRIVAKIDELMAFCGELEVRLSARDNERSGLLEALLQKTLEPVEICEAMTQHDGC